MKFTFNVLAAFVSICAASYPASAAPDINTEASTVLTAQYRHDDRPRYERRDNHRYDRHDEFLTERQIVRRLKRKGFVEIEDIYLRRDTYVVEAIRPNGAVIRLAVDATDGGIISRERIGWVGRGYGRGGRFELNLSGGSVELYAR